MIFGVPRFVFVMSIFFVAIVIIFAFSPPKSACHATVEAFSEMQRGRLFASGRDAQNRSPRYLRELDRCKLGNSSGACLEFFSIIRGVIRDLQAVSQVCMAEFNSNLILLDALRSSVALIVEIAWGEEPRRDDKENSLGWLEPGDLVLYCSAKDQLLRILGPEDYDAYVNSVLSSLPGEKSPQQSKGCQDCEVPPRRAALEMMSREEVWVRSLFSLNCERFR